MKKSDAVSIALVISGLAFVVAVAMTSRACADDLPPCAPGVELRNALVEHQGREGIWFDIRVADCMSLRLDLFQERIQLLEERNIHRDAQIQLFRRMINASKEAQQLMLSTFDMMSRRVAAAEQEADSIWRSPFLWTGIGVVATLAVGALVVFGLGAA